ncbi:hypothetical protein AVEN_55045-1 [Araneus ventricosus]|uniref:Uncharacterized protein n=1 Tax=Araneus ventricosus TaxID=182803 RepID=A0A4Y2IG16_ARAVE|nr:hypothetical protein AVEN_55045-1 [Araneus ventricosus]
MHQISYLISRKEGVQNSLLVNFILIQSPKYCVGMRCTTVASSQEMTHLWDSSVIRRGDIDSYKFGHSWRNRSTPSGERSSKTRRQCKNPIRNGLIRRKVWIFIFVRFPFCGLGHKTEMRP